MSRRRRLSRPILLGALALLTLVLVPSLLGSSYLPWNGFGLGGGSSAGGRVDVPLHTVERQDFEHRVRGEGVLSAVQATPLSPDSSIRAPLRVAWMVPDGSRVEAGDPVVRFDATEFEEALEEARDELTKTGLQITREKIESSSQIENLGRDEELAAMELEAARRFQKKDAGIFTRHEIIEADIDEELAEQKREHAVQVRESRRELSRTELQILAIEERQARQKKKEAEQQLASLEIVAPHDGVVTFKRWRGSLPRVGDQVWPGNVVAELPDLSEMQAEIYVLEADAGGLEEGKAAEVVLEAHPDTVYPAEVARVDALAKPRIRQSPVQYFAVTLSLAETDPERMKPGQRVRADLVLAQEEDVLVIPRQAVFEGEGGSKIVYRRTAGGFEAVPVTLGFSGLGRVVVASGLEEGDRIALAEPGAAAGSGDGERSGPEVPRISPGPGGMG